MTHISYIVVSFVFGADAECNEDWQLYSCFFTVDAVVGWERRLWPGKHHYSHLLTFCVCVVECIPTSCVLYPHNPQNKIQKSKLSLSLSKNLVSSMSALNYTCFQLSVKDFLFIWWIWFFHDPKVYIILRMILKQQGCAWNIEILLSNLIVFRKVGQWCECVGVLVV